MTDAVILGLISSGFGLLGTAISALAAYFSQQASIKANQANKQSIENGVQIGVIKHATNSMKDALVKVTSQSSYKDGLRDGKEGTEERKPPD